MAITASITVVFDVDCESATFGKFVITDTSDYAGEGIALADVTGTVTVTYPDGDSTIAAINPSTSLVNNTIAIPQDANGDYMQGIYTFAYSIVVTGSVQPGTYTTSSNYDYCPTLAFPASGCYLPQIAFISDCFCLRITATDETDYGTPTTITRDIILYPPPSLGLPSVSTSAASLVYPFSYTGGYEVAVDTLVTYVDGIVTVSGRVKGSCYEEVKCDVNLCSLYNCMKKMFASLERKAGLLGGKNNLPLELQDKWDTLIELDMLFDHALKCGQYADAQTYYDRIEALVDCDCGCQEGAGPQLVNPYCGGGAGSGTTTVVTGTGNITVSSVTVGTTITYTVAMTSGFVAQITAIQNSITALQASITSINNTIAALPPKQYYLLSTAAGTSENTATTSEETLRTYTLPADTLEIGDILTITTEFRLGVNNNAKTIKLLYGGTGLTLALGAGPSANPGSVSRTVAFHIRITKTAVNQVLREVWSVNNTTTPTTVSGINADYPTDANNGSNVIINANGQSPVSGAAGDVNCTKLTVELFKAP